MNDCVKIYTVKRECRCIIFFVSRSDRGSGDMEANGNSNGSNALCLKRMLEQIVYILYMCIFMCVIIYKYICYHMFMCICVHTKDIKRHISIALVDNLWVVQRCPTQVNQRDLQVAGPFEVL